MTDSHSQQNSAQAKALADELQLLINEYDPVISDWAFRRIVISELILKLRAQLHQYESSLEILRTANHAMRETLEVVRASLAWRPIETAPSRPLDKNGYGPTILIWVESAVGIGFWDDDFGQFFVEASDRHPQPTHWRPLPEPPAPATDAAGGQHG